MTCSAVGFADVTTREPPPAIQQWRAPRHCGAARETGNPLAVQGVLPCFNRRFAMADDKSRTGGPDRRRVAAKQPYEVGYFASKHHISRAEAREIIQKAGPN